MVAISTYSIAYHLSQVKEVSYFLGFCFSSYKMLKAVVWAKRHNTGKVSVQNGYSLHVYFYAINSQNSFLNIVF